MQAQVEELTGQAGLQILRAILENEVTHGGTSASAQSHRGLCALGKAAGLCGFAGQKIPLERPRVRTREGQEVELESYGQLQQDGNYNERCASAWWPDCPRGTIGERWGVFWKATGSRKQREPAVSWRPVAISCGCCANGAWKI